MLVAFSSGPANREGFELICNGYKCPGNSSINTAKVKK